MMIATKILFLALATGCLATYPISESEETIEFLGKTFYKNGPILTDQHTSPHNFRQCVDHFNASGCEKKYDQRFWVREDYYRDGGPIFFMFGGEIQGDGMIDTNWIWHKYAEHYNAMLIVLEHRFYGLSFPAEGDTFEDMQLLTSQQALADAAYFIDDFKQTRGLLENDWVAFGCSYAGNLAAWFKQKYPTYVRTAVSSSGPLLATYDFPGYMETASDVILATDQSCYDRIYDAFNCMESLINGSTCGNYRVPDDILPAIHQCGSIDFSDRPTREMWFRRMSMYRWGSNSPLTQAIRNCRGMENITGNDALDFYGNFLEAMGEGGCETNSLSDPRVILRSQGKKSVVYTWGWQTCYEFGYYMSADPKHGLFGYDTWSGDANGGVCNEFGERFTRAYTEERIRQTNEYYKGKEIDSKCVIFVNGEWDPWHTLGLYEESERTVNNTIVYIPKLEHCSDYIDPPRSEDGRWAQERIQKQIGIYLNDPNCL